MGLVEDVWGLDESYWGLVEAVWGLDKSYLGATEGCLETNGG